MKFNFKRKYHLILFAVAIIVAVLVGFNYIVSSKIHKAYFSAKNLYGEEFLKSYDIIKITYKNEEFKLYHSINHSSYPNILYIPSNHGILPSILNSQLNSNANLFILDYPKNDKFHNMKSFTEIINVAVEQINKDGIKNEQLIIFGHNIGANAVLEYSQNKNFKSVLLLNLLPKEKQFCNTFLHHFFCIAINSSFDFEQLNQNSVYFFFNENVPIILNMEQNFDIFNAINANEKFLFEIPGTNLNFNFNHIMQFYDNAVLHDKIFEYTNTDHSHPNQDMEEVIDIDGLLNPDEYID